MGTLSQITTILDTWVDRWETTNADFLKSQEKNVKNALRKQNREIKHVVSTMRSTIQDAKIPLLKDELEEDKNGSVLQQLKTDLLNDLDDLQVPAEYARILDDLGITKILGSINTER